MLSTIIIYYLFFLSMFCANYQLAKSIDTQSRRFVMRVMYDGTKFMGFQSQPNARTVQGVLSDMISKRIGQSIPITGASRTDLGVHSRGNCVHINIPNAVNDFDQAKFQYHLNQMLPLDLKIDNFMRAPETSVDGRVVPLHATSSTNGKLYTYTFCTNQVVDPIRRRYCAHFHPKLDLTLFRESLTEFVGTHDFVSFVNAVAKTKTQYESQGNVLNTTRSIRNISLESAGEEPGYYKISFRLPSALNRMLRNVVGSCLQVAQGTMSLQELRSLLVEAPGRLSNSARPAPPEGLVLEHVYYDNY